MLKIPNDLAEVFETILWEMWKKRHATQIEN